MRRSRCRGAASPIWRPFSAAIPTRPSASRWQSTGKQIPIVRPVFRPPKSAPRTGPACPAPSSRPSATAPAPENSPPNCRTGPTATGRTGAPRLPGRAADPEAPRRRRRPAPQRDRIGRDQERHRPVGRRNAEEGQRLEDRHRQEGIGHDHHRPRRGRPHRQPPEMPVRGIDIGQDEAADRDHVGLHRPDRRIGVEQPRADADRRQQGNQQERLGRSLPAAAPPHDPGSQEKCQIGRRIDRLRPEGCVNALAIGIDLSCPFHFPHSALGSAP